jgi:hypothetical protein
MEKYKLVILVFACDTIEKYRNQIIAINETFGKKCQEYNDIKLIYFLGENITEKSICKTNTDKNTSYVYIDGVKDDYESSSYKQWLGLKYIYENYAFDFVICIGTDTYLNIPKMMRFLDSFDPTINYYIGGHGCNRQIGNDNYYFHSGGSGFILTYPVVKKLHIFLPYIMEHWKYVCIKNDVEYLINACDVGISYYINNIKELNCLCVIDDLVFKSCNYKGWPCHIGQIDMTQLISCHFMRIEDVKKFTQILEKNNYFM